MNEKIATILARYGARLLALLGAANLALLTNNPHFATLASEPAGIADLVLAGGWLVHVLASYADTGRVPDVPPVAATSELVSAEPLGASLAADIARHLGVLLESAAARPWQAFHRNEQGPAPAVAPLPVTAPLPPDVPPPPPLVTTGVC